MWERFDWHSKMGSPVLGDHNTGIKKISNIVYQYCDFLLVYSTVVSIVIGIVEMLVPG
jgi:hypothetical protein